MKQSNTSTTGTGSVKGTRVRFRLPYLPAHDVRIAGSFNGWNPSQLALKESRSGEWEVVLVLPPGEHEYLFVADGRWIADPNNPLTRPNPFGGVNSVICVPAAGPKSRRKPAPR